jgi:hypothetical protein
VRAPKQVVLLCREVMDASGAGGVGAGGCGAAPCGLVCVPVDLVLS